MKPTNCYFIQILLASSEICLFSYFRIVSRSKFFSKFTSFCLSKNRQVCKQNRSKHVPPINGNREHYVVVVCSRPSMQYVIGPTTPRRRISRATALAAPKHKIVGRSDFPLKYDVFLCSDSMVYWIARPLGIWTFPSSRLVESLNSFSYEFRHFKV